MNDSTAYLLDIRELSRVLLRSWRALTAALVAGGVAFGGVAVLRPVTYTAEALVRPRTASGNLNQLGGIAADLGVNLAGAAGGDAPPYFTELLSATRTLAAARDSLLLRKPFDGNVESLAEFFGVDIGIDERDRMLDEINQRLADGIVSRIDAASGTVSIRYQCEVRERCIDVVDAALRALVSIANEVKRTESEEHLRAISPIRDSAAVELKLAEDALSVFLERNRAGLSFPSVQADADRLRRNIAVKLQTLTTLDRAYTDAQVSAMRVVSPLHVIQPATASTLGDSKRLALWFVVGAIVGGGVFVLWSVGNAARVMSRSRMT
jgi:uncharacterized protein involved in exopolysaccharide biosynthesis